MRLDRLTDNRRMETGHVDLDDKLASETTNLLFMFFFDGGKIDNASPLGLFVAIIYCLR